MKVRKNIPKTSSIKATVRHRITFDDNMCTIIKTIFIYRKQNKRIRTNESTMGNHQANAKRQHRPSECVGFNKHDSDDERLVTIQRREQRVIEDEIDVRKNIFRFIVSNKKCTTI